MCIHPAHNSVHKDTLNIHTGTESLPACAHKPPDPTMLPRTENLALRQEAAIPLSEPLPPPQQRKPTNHNLNCYQLLAQGSAADCVRRHV